ncbi:MMPL family transporter [Streptomyces zagrosensis]|uniref:RND superfamily putative drug exporter n=1 Tax=Streptomyces zagrosensis TaxID=1042984 RepID=A0A7W9Q956_9ACTN|nr:MMPL family transporter [Streptomyces zagrosensis]MBB5935915.1 RND superfamily putative drug exporter [Streptomyces zagrosensis]
MAALARWCLERRLVVIVLWLAVLAGFASAAAVAGTAYSNDYDVPGTESARAAALVEKAFPGQDGDSSRIVWHAGQGGEPVRSATVEARMTATLDKIEDLPGVASVGSPYEGADGARQISPDGRTAYAIVAFERPAGDLPVSQVRAVVDTAKDAEGEGLRVEAGGSAIALTEKSGTHLSELIGIAVAAVVLFVAFGSLAASLLPIITAVVAVGTATMGITLLGHVMTVADFAPMLGMLIGLGVGIDYALFIVTRHRKGLRAGLPVRAAAECAVATTGRAVAFAGGTVCVALLGMLVLRLDFLNGVAIAASLTVVLTVAASITLLPALLGVIGMRALSRRERRRLAAGGSRPDEPTGLAARWSGFVERHPRLLGGAAAAVMLVLALPTFALHLGTSDESSHPASSTTRQAYDLLAGSGADDSGPGGGAGGDGLVGDDLGGRAGGGSAGAAGAEGTGGGFGPGVNGPLTLVAHIDGADDRVALDRLVDTLRHTDGVASVQGANTEGANIEGSATHSRGDIGVITVVPETSPQSQQTSDLVNRLRTEVIPRAERGTSLAVYVGGLTAGYDDFADVIVGKLPLFVGVVVGLGCLLLLLAFRSVGIPLKAAAMNIAAVASSFGVVVAVFQWGWGSELLGLGSAGPIAPFLPVIMISVLFGLSMDYQVFLVSRMYEEWLKTRDNCRAVRVGLAETSRVINSAAVIMIAVFAAFVLSGDRIIAMFGIGLAVAVALDAFLLRTLLVPALMHLLGSANWWLPAWLDRWLPRISIEPPERSAAPASPSRELALWGAPRTEHGAAAPSSPAARPGPARLY